ncbi:hypothetical protein Slu03_11800 [Sediminihabitans luteus]|nr:hypothetical protein Slu03_11800 [Sediminihabitans luteus]
MLACVALGAIALTGCGDDGEAEPAVPDAWPLTGVRSDDVTVRPALAVKIENSVPARPQTGLDQADVVWEEVVEGGITRFVAVYHSQVPGEVGPIRSVRPMDPAVVAPLGGPFVFTGGQDPFLADVADAGIQAIVMDDGDPGFYRTDDRAAPHDVYADPQDFWDQADADHDDLPPAQFAFAESAQESTAATAGDAAGTLTARFSGVQTTVWTWASGAYERSDGDVPAVDAGGSRLTAANVVVLSVRMVDTGYLDPAGNPVPESELVGTGTGLLLSQGKAVEVAWSKDDVGAVLALTGPDGEPALLAPGSTWVELVPSEGGSFTTS